MASYEELLNNAMEKLPKTVVTASRYELPKVKGHVEGNKTIIINFNQICSTLNRDVQHVLKYLLKGLATPGKLEDHRLIFGRKLSSTLINAKIEEYANKFVLCYDCKKPDTKLITENRVIYLKCTACGAKHHAKATI